MIFTCGIMKNLMNAGPDLIQIFLRPFQAAVVTIFSSKIIRRLYVLYSYTIRTVYE